MSRRPFGGETAVQDELGNVFSNQTNKGNVWSAPTGGSAVIDLQTPAGGSITSVSTDAHGQFSFLGPNDGTAKLWIDFGFGRFLIEATDVTDRLADLEQLIADAGLALGVGNAGGFPGPLDANGDLPIGQIPGVGLNNGIAATGSDGFVLDAGLSPLVPYYATAVLGVVQARAYYTQNATRSLIWRTDTDPTFTAGYAQPNDLWIDANGQLWLAGNDRTWHGTTAGTAPPVTLTGNIFFSGAITSITGGTSAGVLFGAAPGGNGATRMNAMFSTLGSNFVRTFETTPSAFGSNNQGQYVQTGVPQCNSVKPDLTVMGDNTNAGYTAMRNQYRTYYGGMPDIPGQYACCHHEPEGDVGGTGQPTKAQFRASQVNMANDVIDFVNLSRTNPIKYITILQGFTLQSSSGRDITDYIDSTVLAAVDAVGFDVYSAAQITLAAQYSAANGNKTWAIPEFGYSSANVGTDAQIVAFMQANAPGLKTMNNAPAFVCWFDSLENTLNTYVTANASNGATTFQVDALPGHGTAKDLPNGSPIRIDTTGTVISSTTNADSAGSSSPYTVHVPALSHSLTSGAIVEIKPQSAAYWKLVCT